MCGSTYVLFLWGWAQFWRKSWIQDFALRPKYVISWVFTIRLVHWLIYLFTTQKRKKGPGTVFQPTTWTLWTIFTHCLYPRVDLTSRSATVWDSFLGPTWLVASEETPTLLGAEYLSVTGLSYMRFFGNSSHCQVYSNQENFEKMWSIILVTIFKFDISHLLSFNQKINQICVGHWPYSSINFDFLTISTNNHSNRNSHI